MKLSLCVCVFTTFVVRDLFFGEHNKSIVVLHEAHKGHTKKRGTRIKIVLCLCVLQERDTTFDVMPVRGTK